MARDSHRLAWYAASVSAETGEQMWRALSERYFDRLFIRMFDGMFYRAIQSHVRWNVLSSDPVACRYFEGKRTSIRPIRLDNLELLLECAEEVGLDRAEVQRVLSSDAYRAEV